MIMKRTAKNLIAIAVAEIGYHEKETCSNLDNDTANSGDGNHTKYGRDLHDAGYYNSHDKCGYAWCDQFVDWCFWKLCDEDAEEAQKMSCQSGPYGAGCVYSKQYYENAGRYYTSNPKPGDQIFFSSTGRIDHTGIVETVNGNTITTVEGNTSDRVARRTYSLNSSYIKGFGRPIFSDDMESDNKEEDNKNNDDSTVPDNGKTPSINKPSTSDEELVDGIYTVKRGDSWWGMATKFLGSSSKRFELAEFNGKTINTMIHPGDKIKIPGKYNGNTTSKPESDYTKQDYTLYTVNRGDSWWGIAAKEMGSGLKMYKLAAYNGKNITHMLHPKDVLKIPK
jgi:LysM repeat protein